MDNATREIEEELYTQLDEDCGKKLVNKIAQERDDDSKDVKTGLVFKNKNGKLVIDRKDVSQVWEELLNKRENGELEQPGSVEGQVKREEIGNAEVKRAMTKVKRDRATGVVSKRFSINQRGPMLGGN